MSKRTTIASDHEHTPWLAKILGLDWFLDTFVKSLDERIGELEAKIEAQAVDRATLEEALATLRGADATIDEIEPTKE